jgi:hypothetical protein
MAQARVERAISAITCGPFYVLHADANRLLLGCKPTTWIKQEFHRKSHPWPRLESNCNNFIEPYDYGQTWTFRHWASEQIRGPWRNHWFFGLVSQDGIIMCAPGNSTRLFDARVQLLYMNFCSAALVLFFFEDPCGAWCALRHTNVVACTVLTSSHGSCSRAIFFWLP